MSYPKRLAHSHVLRISSIAALCVACRATLGPKSEVQQNEARIALNEGSEAIERGELELGIELCLQALEESAGNEELEADAHAWLLHGFSRDDDPESALRHAHFALELRPEDPWLWYARGIAFQELGLSDDAVESLSRAIEIDEQHIKAHQWRAHISQSQGNFSEALEDWERALELIALTSDEVLHGWGGDRAAMTATCERARGECRDALGY